MANARLPPDLPPVGDTVLDALDLIAAGSPGEAASLLRALLESGRGGLLARIALTRALAAQGDIAAALEIARETAGLHPEAAPAALASAEALAAGGYLPAAIGECQRALRLDPELAAARLLLGSVWLEAGEADRALDALAALDPATPGLAAKIAAAQAMKAQPRSDAGYVRHLFDQFSADYDTRMRESLRYRAPEILRALAGFVLPGAQGLSILDLGCGTGLAGEAFRAMAARLDGIDLSPAMIEKARARGIYNVLRVGDIEEAPDGSYDLVLAVDTLVYLGDLTPVFSAARRALKPGGHFLFTVEKQDGAGFELGPKRRWRHSEPYLRETAAGAGFSIESLVACEPRTEAKRPVEGFAVALAKASGAALV